MKTKISKSYLEKCLNELILNSKNDIVTDNEKLSRMFSDIRKQHAIKALSAIGAVKCRYYDNSDVPYFIVINDEAFLLLHNIYNDKIVFVRGFIIGIISGVLINLLSTALL